MNHCVRMPPINMSLLQLLAASRNGGGPKSVGNNNTEIDSRGFDGQCKFTYENIMRRKAADTFVQRTSTYRGVTRSPSSALIDE